MKKLTESSANSNGVYSLYKGWLKKPVKDDIPDNIDLEPELSEWKRRANECSTIEEVDSFIDDLYKLRQESILTEGEYGRGNLIFKEIRNSGLLQDLKDKKVELETKDMSLESLQEEVSNLTDLTKEVYEKYRDEYNSTSDIDAIYDQIMDEYKLPDLANDVCDMLENDSDEVYVSTDYEEEEPEEIEESLDDYIARRTQECIEDYRRRAGIDESVEITEENLDEWALRGTCCYNNYDPEDLKPYLFGGKKNEG